MREVLNKKFQTIMTIISRNIPNFDRDWPIVKNIILNSFFCYLIIFSSVIVGNNISTQIKTHYWSQDDSIETSITKISKREISKRV